MSFQAVTKMIQEAFSYVEQTPDLETKLKLIDTLRTVTAGKVQTNLGHFDSITQVLQYSRLPITITRLPNSNLALT